MPKKSPQTPPTKASSKAVKPSKQATKAASKRSAAASTVVPIKPKKETATPKLAQGKVNGSKHAVASKALVAKPAVISKPAAATRQTVAIPAPAKPAKPVNGSKTALANHKPAPAHTAEPKGDHRPKIGAAKGVPAQSAITKPVMIPAPVKGAAVKGAAVKGAAKPAASKAAAAPEANAVRFPNNSPVPLAPVPTDGKPKKNQAGLGLRDLEHFRELLLAKRRELVGDMTSMEREALRSANGTNLSNLPLHMADMGTDNYEQEFTLGLVEKERGLLRELNRALAKIQDGTYGICEGTGKPINRPRLEAQPWARFSIEHARMMERGLVRR